MQEHIRRAEVEKHDDWHGWIRKIPHFAVKTAWEIQVIPPFGGAVARFCVRLKDCPRATVPVYLDCYERLGCWSGPYWEIYPYDDDVARCHMDHTKELEQLISTSLRKQKRDLKNATK